MDQRQALEAAVALMGVRTIAAIVGRRYQAVQQWRLRGRLPRTEHTGETNYAALIAQACREKDPATAITREALLGLGLRPAQPAGTAVHA